MFVLSKEVTLREGKMGVLGYLLCLVKSKGLRAL